MAYRNLKSVVPLLRPGELFDRQLADLDRALFAGNDPAALMHSVLGTGLSTHVLSAAYAAFIVFLPRPSPSRSSSRATSWRACSTRPRCR